MASAAVSPKPSRKFVKENSELKKRCKELEEKLAEIAIGPKISSENLEEIANMRQHCKEVEGKASQLEQVVVEKEEALQVRFKEEQAMQLRSKELEEEKFGLMQQCRQLEEALSNNTKEKEGEEENRALQEKLDSERRAAETAEAMQRLTSDLNLANEEREAAVEEARSFKERFVQLELTSTLQREELESQWESKLEEKDNEAIEKSQNIKRLEAEVQGFKIELESKNENEEKEALAEVDKEVETLRKQLEECEKQGLDFKASLENEQGRLKAAEERAQSAEKELNFSKEQLLAAEEKYSSAEAAMAELELKRGEAGEDQTVEAEMAELRCQLKREREEWKKEGETLKQKLDAMQFERESHLKELVAARSKGGHLEESQSQLIKEKERLEVLLCDAQTDLGKVKASEKETQLKLEDELKFKATADEVADALRAEVAASKLMSEERERDLEGEVERLNEAGRILESKLADLQSKLESASLRETNLMETINALQTNLSGEERQKKEESNALRSSLAEEQVKVDMLRRCLEEKEGMFEAARIREANTIETILLLQNNISEANLRVTSLTEKVSTLQNQLAESSSQEKAHVEAIDSLQKDLSECRLKESSLTETIESLNKNLVELSSKEKNLTEAMTSLKSINEMVTKAARKSEARYRQAIEEQGNVVEEKARVEAILIKVEGEKVQMESLLTAEHEKTSKLRHDLDQLMMSSKEERATEEKDVDEAEVALDKNMMQVLVFSVWCLVSK